LGEEFVLSRNLIVYYGSLYIDKLGPMKDVPMTRRNIYKHSIELKQLKIKNTERNEFARKLEEILYRDYEVEDITDGRKIVIVRPGGKQAWGKMRKKDFYVFIYNPSE